MGDIADDMINGFQCSGCGICFEDEHGYPVLCDDCYRDQAEDIRNGIVKEKDKIPKHTIPELG